MKWEFPRPVADLCADLAGQGFDVLDERRAAGGPQLVLQGPVRVAREWLEAFIRIAADNGQWSISVRFEGMSHWITVPAWAAYLDGPDLARLDLNRRARFVRYRLPEAAETIRTAPYAERELVQLAEAGRLT